MSESILDMEEGLRKSYARSMESLLQIAESSYTISAIVVCLSMVWHQLVEKAVPKPYLVCPPASRERWCLTFDDRMSFSTSSKPNCIFKAAFRNGIQR